MYKKKPHTYTMCLSVSFPLDSEIKKKKPAGKVD